MSLRYFHYFNPGSCFKDNELRSYRYTQHPGSPKKILNKTLDFAHKSNVLFTKLIYCCPGAIPSPQWGTQGAMLTKIFVIRIVEGRSRSLIWSYGCDQREGY